MMLRLWRPHVFWRQSEFPPLCFDTFSGFLLLLLLPPLFNSAGKLMRMSSCWIDSSPSQEDDDLRLFHNSDKIEIALRDGWRTPRFFTQRRMHWTYKWWRMDGWKEKLQKQLFSYIYSISIHSIYSVFVLGGVYHHISSMFSCLPAFISLMCWVYWGLAVSLSS